jgi:hypothetical protein
MRIFTLIGVYVGGSFADGTAAPALPRNHSVPLDTIAAAALMPVFKPGASNVVEGQVLSLQLAAGESLPLMINKTPDNAANRQKIEQKFKSLLADLADDTKLTIEWTFEELA